MPLSLTERRMKKKGGSQIGGEARAASNHRPPPRGDKKNRNSPVMEVDGGFQTNMERLVDLTEDSTRLPSIAAPSRWQINKKASGLSRVQHVSSMYSPPI